MEQSIVLSGDLPRTTISRMVHRQEVFQIARGVYSPDDQAKSNPTLYVRSNLYSILGRLMPGAVITDRSGLNAMPVDGVLYVAWRKNRTVDLPGVKISARLGCPPLEGDVRLPGGAYYASRWRALAENAIPTRARSSTVSRTLLTSELHDAFAKEASVRDLDTLALWRTQTEEHAKRLLIPPKQTESLNDLYGSILGSFDIPTPSRILRERIKRSPYDSDRSKRFELLATALRDIVDQSHPVDPHSTPMAPLFDAYFSNFIEGTEFEIEQARQIIENDADFGRYADSHDIKGTYEILVSIDLSPAYGSPEDFLSTLRERHRLLMSAHPTATPGEFKTIANRAGNTVFVQPELVRGTLMEGYSLASGLETPWQRAVYLKFVVAETHPFIDGNGRMSRVTMNAELTPAGESCIVVPTVFREEYLGSLRRLSRDDDPAVYIQAMRYLHDVTAAIDFTTFDRAVTDLRAMNAFSTESSDRLQPLARRAPEVVTPSKKPIKPAPWGVVAPYTRADGTRVSGYPKPR
jgi:Fic/DOC family